jgi:HSP20 family protein
MFNLIPWKKERTADTAVARRDDNPFGVLRREFDSLFDRVFGNLPLAGGEWGPAGWGLEVDDKGKELVVRAEAPGFEAGDFDVQVSGDVLHVRAERRQEEKAKEGGTTRYGAFERWVTLPPGTDRDKVEARYRNGVLEVHLPKTPEAQGRRVEVKA